MHNPKPLLLVGNKRSGTSHLVRLLNLHPAVFVAHESDVTWILYQLANDLPFRCYPWDGPLGMEATLSACADLLDRTAVVAQPKVRVPELFSRILQRLMERGSSVQQPHAKRNLTWIGDKKPVQNADPELLAFTRTYFPEARYVHIIRHPKSVVSSMLAAGKEWAQVEHWKGSQESVQERWAIHEEWVLAAKGSVPVFSLRYEDLCSNPKVETRRLFQFLDLELTDDLVERLAAQTTQGADSKHAGIELPSNERAERIMERYGYRASPEELKTPW